MLILAGFEEGEIEKIRAVDEVIPVSQEHLDWKVERIIEEKPIGDYRRIQCTRTVIMHSIPNEKIREVMREIRNLVKEHIIFATTTPTSLNWTLGNLISELEEEDAYFRGKR